MSDIHVTERSLFKECRRHHKYAYREQLQSVSESRGAYWLGRGVHYGLAEFYRNPENQDHHAVKAFREWIDIQYPSDIWSNLSEADRSDVRHNQELAEGMIQGYTDFARENDDFKVVAVETPLKIRIPGTRGHLVGTLDLVVRRRGKLWVVDHKTVGERIGFVDPETLELDDQMTAYLWLVWKSFGEFPQGAIYNQLLKKLPQKPQLLKNGRSLSKDKSIATTRSIYLETINEYGFDPDDYSDLLTALDGDNRFFRREIIARNRRELETFEFYLTHEYREMVSKSTVLYPNPTRNCIFYCRFRDLCRAEQEQADVESIKAVNYIVSEGRRI